MWLPDVEDIVEIGCTYERLGEACRWVAYDALEMYGGLTARGDYADDWADKARRYLDRGCQLHDAESCAILRTGRDFRGREYPIGTR